MKVGKIIIIALLILSFIGVYMFQTNESIEFSTLLGYMANAPYISINKIEEVSLPITLRWLSPVVSTINGFTILGGALVNIAIFLGYTMSYFFS